MIRRLRAMFVIVLMTVPFAHSTSAGAQTCAPTDLACTADQVGGAAQDVGDNTAGTAQDGVDSAVDTGQNAVDTAHTTTKDAVGTVRNTIDRVLGGGGNPPAPGDGGAGGGGSGRGDGPGDSNASGHHSQGGAGSSPATRGTAGDGAGSGGLLPASPTGGAEPGVPAVDLSSHPNDRASSPTLGTVAAGVISGIALMAVLLGAVVAFLAFQDRIDRRDPKLELAAIGSDRVSFA